MHLLGSVHMEPVEVTPLEIADELRRRFPLHAEICAQAIALRKLLAEREVNGADPEGDHQP